MTPKSHRYVASFPGLADFYSRRIAQIKEHHITLPLALVDLVAYIIHKEAQSQGLTRAVVERIDS